MVAAAVSCAACTLRGADLCRPARELGLCIAAARTASPSPCSGVCQWLSPVTRRQSSELGAGTTCLVNVTPAGARGTIPIPIVATALSACSNLWNLLLNRQVDALAPTLLIGGDVNATYARAFVMDPLPCDSYANPTVSMAYARPLRRCRCGARITRHHPRCCCMLVATRRCADSHGSLHRDALPVRHRPPRLRLCRQHHPHRRTDGGGGADGARHLRCKRHHHPQQCRQPLRRPDRWHADHRCRVPQHAPGIAGCPDQAPDGHAVHCDLHNLHP